FLHQNTKGKNHRFRTLSEFVLSVERALGRENCGERGPSITLNSCTCLFDRPFFRGIPFRSGCRCISGRKQFI
ncbi:unnamed protein product, partial [Nesidiocoris tenuis]